MKARGLSFISEYAAIQLNRLSPRRLSHRWFLTAATTAVPSQEVQLSVVACVARVRETLHPLSVEPPNN
jgi:hypothetical protein